MVVLVLLAQALEDLEGLVDRRRLDHDGLEAALERAVLLDVLAVLVQRRGAHALQLAARERRLQHVGGVDGALGRAGAHQGVQLVDEQDDVPVGGDLVHDRLEPLLELAAVLGAGDDRGHVERQHAVVAQHVGTLPARDEQGQALDDGRLADAGFADEHRVVLLAARQDFHHALDFAGAADGRVELAFRGELREVAAEVVERRGLGLLLGLGRRLRLARRRGRRRLREVAAEEPERLGAGLLEAHAGVGEHLRGDALFLAQQAEEQVLGADVAVVELARLDHGQLEDLLGARGVRQVGTGGRGGFPALDRLLDLLLDVLEIDVEVLQDAGGDALALANQAEEDVLRPHVLVVQAGRFFAGHLQDLPDAVGEIVAVHRVTLLAVLRLAAAPARNRRVGWRATGRRAPRRAPTPGAPAACEPASC